jgi:hypothetical protein
MGCEAAIASEHYLDITTRQKGHQVMPGSTLAKHDLSRVIHPHRVKHTFCDIDPEYTHLLLHWTRLLWLHGFTDFEIIVAHRSRSAQGRVHFITTRQHVSRLVRSALSFSKKLANHIGAIKYFICYYNLTKATT